MTEKDYSNIFKQVEQVVRKCNDLPDTIPMDMSHWIVDWMYGKSTWLQLMPDLRVELPEPITFTIDEESQKHLYQNFCNNCLIDDYPELYYFLEKLSFQEFFGKYLKSDYEFFDENTEEKVVIPKGTKIIKAFKFFHLLDSDLKELQSEASRMIQQDSITGILGLSIHPLDYLSISENVANWRSCHSLDGIYRAGNLSYMFDRSTIIAYLRSEDDVQLPHFPEGLLWNNKKWRMLLHFDSQCHLLIHSKAYPFSSSGAYNPIIKLLNQVMKPISKWFTKFTNDFLNTSAAGRKCSNLIYLNNCAKPLQQIVTQDDYNLAYPDLLFNNQIPYHWSYGNISFQWFNAIDNDTGGFDTHDDIFYAGLVDQYTKIVLGSPVMCPVCNKTFLTTGDSMICENCEEAFFSPEETYRRRKERDPNGYK